MRCERLAAVARTGLMALIPVAGLPVPVPIL